MRCSLKPASLYSLIVAGAIVAALITPLRGQAGVTLFEGARLITGDGRRTVHKRADVARRRPKFASTATQRLT